MATELKLRKGTTTEHGNFIGAEAEATVDTDKNTIVVHDGQTQGGFPLAKEDTVSTYSDLRSEDVSKYADGYIFYVGGRSSVGDGGEGHFRWDSSDLSTEVGNDEVTAGEGDGGIYVAPDSDKTGSSGAWVRQSIKRGSWYGNVLQTIDVRSGNFQVGGSPRASDKPSDVYWHVDLGDNYQTDSGNQTPRVFHVKGTMPDIPDHAGQSFLHAFSYDLTSQETTGDMGEVRGVKGTVIGDGGSSTTRSIHATAAGKNGYTGLLTGIMGTADYTDQTDGAFNNVGNGVGVAGQVGAGCMANFIANSFKGPQRPSFAYTVEGTDDGVLPEVSCFEGHGGGNGALFSGRRDETNTDIIYAVDNKGRVQSPSYCSGRRSISDDSSITIDVPSASGSSGFIEIGGVDNTGVYGKAYFRSASNISVASIYSGNNTSFAAGFHGGTTGTDGEVTVGVRSDGKIDIENRTGSDLEIMWHFITTTEFQGQLN